MSDIKSWSNSAGGNTAASPNGFPEGMAPSGVNDSMRETMASVKRWYESAEWLDFGHTPTYVGTGSFLVSAGQAATATYHIGRRIKALDGANTIYGTIHSSTWTASAVYIYTTNDGAANFTASLSGIAVGSTSFVNPSVGYAINAGSANSASSASKAQYALQGYDAVAASVVNFGTTASANTIPIADATGKLPVGWIPVTSVNSWDFVTYSCSLSISGTSAKQVHATEKTILPGSAKYYMKVDGYDVQKMSNGAATTSTLTIETSASGNLVATIMPTGTYSNFSGSYTLALLNAYSGFTYSASKTETLVVALSNQSGFNRCEFFGKIKFMWRN